jgi:F-type H+-transporting ATPase subunit delta
MSATQIPYRYAKALFDYAQSTNELDRVYSDMQLINKSVDENRELNRVFHSPILKPAKKVEVFNAIFKNHLSKQTLDFVDMLIDKGRENYMEAIAEAFVHMHNQNNNITEAQITTAVALDDNLRTNIKAKLKAQLNREIVLIEKVNPEILGGYILRVNDKQEDKSLTSKLNKKP